MITAAMFLLSGICLLFLAVAVIRSFPLTVKAFGDLLVRVLGGLK